VSFRGGLNYNAMMLTALRKWRFPLLLIVFHLLALAIVVFFQIRWPWLVRSSGAEALLSAALLIFGGADVALLGIWAGLASCRPIARWLAITICTICWCGIYYDQGILRMLRNWSNLGDIDWDYRLFLGLAAIFGLPSLTISNMGGALGVLQRRGAQFKRLTADELHRDAGHRQFQISHLLLLTAVLSFVLGFSANSRQWLSRQISMQWSFAAYAPLYSAETVIFSAFGLATIALVATWAVLGCGRPWLRLAMALATGGFMGFAWAVAFTSPRHQEHLFSNGLFSASVGLLQAALICAVLSIVRYRGYRFASRFDVPPGWSYATNVKNIAEAAKNSSDSSVATVRFLGMARQ